jgi:hypothetical protein
MTKCLKRIGIALLILIIVIVIGGILIIKIAFGPQHKTVTIEINEETVLKCKQTYTADMAAVFYDVDFSLITKNKTTVDLGSATFPTEDWKKDIRLYQIDNWNILSANGFSFSKLLLANQILKKQQDTIFSPHELQYDSLWKTSNRDIPSWPYSGKSNIDTIIGKTINVSFEYRIGDYPPFNIYTQKLEYSLDTKTGQLKTIKVFERIEKKNGS